MAILQALLAAVARSAGKLLNTAFGWATVMIFGKVPEDRQIYLSVMAFGSVIWIAVALGVAFPSLGTFLLSFVPLPKWVSRSVVRLAMLAATILLPVVIGGVSLLLKDPEERPRGTGAKPKAVLKGYPFTLGLALTLVMMTAFAPILKLRTLARRWTSAHVPVLVESRDYEAVLGELEAALRGGGWETRREPASWMLRAPTKVLTTLSGGGVEDLVAERLTTLRGKQLAVTLHPADLVVEGKEADVAHVRARLAEQLAFSHAHLTWTKEGNEVEDRIHAVWDAVQAGGGAHVLGRLRAIEEDLGRLEIQYEEWEVLFRAILLVERAAARAGVGPSTDGWAQRVAAPIGVALVQQTLASPAVRGRLERLVTAFLDRLADTVRSARTSGPRPRAMPTTATGRPTDRPAA
jgi:hypothetical protein